jgi:hypothetical protein
MPHANPSDIQQLKRRLRGTIHLNRRTSGAKAQLHYWDG